MKKPLILSLGIMGAVAATGALWAQTKEPDHAGLFDYANLDVIARGEAIYDENCAACHGANLEGQENWRTPNANGRMPAPPHDVSGHTWHHPDIQLFQIVKYGTAALVGNGYESDMGAYEGILSDQYILDVMAYIKSTWPDEIIARHDAMNAAVASQ